MTADLDRARRLLAHRELQFLRATAARTTGGRAWVRERARKVQEARALVERLERRTGGAA
jgi:hypothetical protein